MDLAIERTTPRIDPVEIARTLAALCGEGAAERDRTRSFPHAEVAALKRSGLLALLVPRSSGGIGGDARALARVLAALAEGDPNIAQMVHVHSYGVELINGAQAPGAVKERYNRRLVEDGILISNAFSEVGTRTVLDYEVKLRRTAGGDWLMSGRKFYCTGSLGGDVFYALGVTDDPEPQFRIGLVERTAAGLTIHDDWSGMGQKTTASGTLGFDDVLIPNEVCFTVDHFATPESLWGSLGQIMFCGIFVGIARAALQDAVEYVRAKARAWPHSGAERAAQDPYTILHIGQMRTLVSAAEVMMERAVDVRLAAEANLTSAARDRASVAAAEAKVVTGDAALRVSEMLFQVCGSGSVVEKHSFDRHWRNARTLTLHDPATYKLRLVGDYALNGTSPPISVYT